MGALLAVGLEREEQLEGGVAAGEHHRDAVHAQAQLAGIGEAQGAAGGGVGEQRGDARVRGGREVLGGDGVGYLAQGALDGLAGGRARLVALHDGVHSRVADARELSQARHTQATGFDEHAEAVGETGHALSLLGNVGKTLN